MNSTMTYFGIALKLRYQEPQKPNLILLSLYDLLTKALNEIDG